MQSFSSEATAARLNELLKVGFKGNVKRFSEALDFPRGGLYKYLNGDAAPGRKLLERIYTAGGNPTYILSGSGDLFADNEAGEALRAGSQEDQVTQRSRGKNILELRGHVSETPAEYNLNLSETPEKGRPKPSEMSETLPHIPLVENPSEPEEWVNVGAWLSASAGSIVCVRAKGPGMVYDDISEGDVLVVDRASRVVSGAVVVAVINGEMVVKRVEMRKSGMYFLSRSEDDVGAAVAPGMNVSFWGAVQFVVRDLRAPPRKNKQRAKQKSE